jgi:hypothetical protein
MKTDGFPLATIGFLSPHIDKSHATPEACCMKNHGRPTLFLATDTESNTPLASHDKKIRSCSASAVGKYAKSLFGLPPCARKQSRIACTKPTGSSLREMKARRANPLEHAT